SKDLHLDATRDFRDIACNVRIFPSVAVLPPPSPKAQGVVFCTYSELISAGRKSSHCTRYDELLAWLCNGTSEAHREAFQGCLIFDEAHKGKNVAGDAKKDSSKTGQCVVRLQLSLPNARVVYSSATGISGVDSMGYLTRMGLWGPRTPFEDFGAFWACFGGI